MDNYPYTFTLKTNNGEIVEQGRISCFIEDFLADQILYCDRPASTFIECSRKDNLSKDGTVISYNIYDSEAWRDLMGELVDTLEQKLMDARTAYKETLIEYEKLD